MRKELLLKSYRGVGRELFPEKQLGGKLNPMFDESLTCNL